MTDLEFTEFVRKPFVVEAVEITEDNIEDIAKLIGAVNHKEDGSPFILVDRRVVPGVINVYPGFFMTRMGDNIRCYSPFVFNKQFTPMTANLRAFVEFHNSDEPAEVTAS